MKKDYLVGIGAIAYATLMIVIFASFLFNQEPKTQMVYYPSWDGSTMYTNKQNVYDLIQKEDRMITDIDSAVLR